MTAPTSKISRSPWAAWSIAPASQTLTHSRHSEQTPQERQRFASDTAWASSKPRFISANPLRSAGGSLGIRALAWGSTTGGV